MIGEDEGAGAVGRLGFALAQAALPYRRRLLIADQPAYRDSRAQQCGIGAGKFAMRIDHARQGIGGHAEQVAQLLRETGIVQPEQQSAARIARIADVFAARKLRDQPALYRSEGQPPCGRCGSDVIVVLQQPAHFGA